LAVAADVLFGVFVLFGLVFGMRRGIYKELIAFAALVVGVAAARTFRDIVGTILQQNTGLEAHASQFAAAAGIFIVVAFVLNVLGRLFLRKLRDPDKEDQIADAAEKVVDKAEGKQKAGPITFITNPFAKTEKGLIYWSDKLGGGVLGVAKGAVAAYVVFGIVYYADMAVDGHWSFTQAIASSHSAELFTNSIAPLLRQVTEFRLLENASRLDRVAHDPETKPNTIDRIVADEDFGRVRSLPSVQKLIQDPEVLRAWDTKDKNGRRDAGALIKLPQVRALLADPEFRSAFAQVDVDAVLTRALGPPATPK
jgi:uncharacterized membrane protein required for colicin V production